MFNPSNNTVCLGLKYLDFILCMKENIYGLMYESNKNPSIQNSRCILGFNYIVVILLSLLLRCARLKHGLLNLQNLF